MAKEKKRGLMKEINMWAFLPASILLLGMIVWGAADRDGFAAATGAALDFVLEHFSWFYSLGVFALVLLCIYAAFSKYGNIRIGGSEAKPEMSMFTWFCIALTSGIAVGIMFWSVAEPLTYYHNPPSYLGIEGGTAHAAEEALRYTFFHWTITPYAIFTAAGLGLVFVYYNCKRKYKISSGFYPLIGEKADGKWGGILDSICMFSLIGGLTTSIGLGAMQLVGGFNYITGQNINSNMIYLAVIGIMCVIYILAACSGLHKGITYISTANVVIYLVMMAAVLIFGGTKFILGNTLTNVGTFLGNFVEQSLYLEPAKQTGWVSDWTIFYWSWWLSCAPMLGLFLVKLAKGRTIRQFVLVNLVAPSVFGLAWFGIFGSAAIHMEHILGLDIFSEITKYGENVALFAFNEHLPFSGLMHILSFLACIFSFLTMAEAMVLAISDSCTKTGFVMDNEQASPNALKIFWGLMLAACGFIMIITGGLDSVQTASVVCGLPALAIVIVLFIAFLKSVVFRERYDVTLSETAEAAGSAVEAPTGNAAETAGSAVESATGSAAKASAGSTAEALLPPVVAMAENLA